MVGAQIQFTKQLHNMFLFHLFNTRIPKLRRWSKNFVSRVNLSTSSQVITPNKSRNMHLGQVISNPDLEGDYSPIDTTEKKWVRTRKKVGTVQIFFPCKPSILCFHEMDPDPLFFQNRKKKKKKKRFRTPFCV